MADVTADQGGDAGQPSPAQALASAGEHRRRPVDADDPGAFPGYRDGDAARAAPELQHAAVLRRGEPLPEGDIPPRHRLRILPVVERRVVVPPRPPFCGRLSGHSSRWPTVAKSMAFWISTKPVPAALAALP